MKNITIISVLGAITLLGAACGTSTNKNSTSTTNTSRDTNTAVNTSKTTGTFTTDSAATNTTIQVTVTASGVDQPMVRVKLGNKIEFRNGDTAPHYLASNPHPIHTDLPGFERNIEPGSSYTFAFTKLGTFGYHDNLDPTNTKFQGKVIVE